MDDKTVILTTCDNAMHAHILQGALENEGIPSMLQNELSASVALQGMIGMGVQILVFEKDLEKAQKILAVDEGISTDDDKEGDDSNTKENVE
jgi:hypothetical protein